MEFFYWNLCKKFKKYFINEKSNKWIKRTNWNKSEINPFNNSKDLISKSEKDYKGKIEFKNISFSYRTNKKQKILKYITFIVNPGGKIGFMRKSGSRKVQQHN